MKRREFFTLLGGALLASPAQAQQGRRAAHLGYLGPASNPDLQQALLGGLRDLGYVEGENLAIEYRFMLGLSHTTSLRQSFLASLPTPLSSSAHHRRLQRNGKPPLFPSFWRPPPILCAPFLVLGAM